MGSAQVRPGTGEEIGRASLDIPISNSDTRHASVALVGGGGFGWGFEAFGEEDERGGDEGDDADDVEAVHEGEELGLRVKLVVDAGVGGAEGVGGGPAVSLQVGCGLVDVLLKRG